MEWPSGAAVGDAVIVRQDPSSDSRFVVHGSHGPQLACATYAEAEAHAASYAEHARANVWYVEHGRLQLVCGFNGGPPRQTTPGLDSHQRAPTPAAAKHGTDMEEREHESSRIDDQRREDLSIGDQSG